MCLRLCISAGTRIDILRETCMSELHRVQYHIIHYTCIHLSLSLYIYIYIYMYIYIYIYIYTHILLLWAFPGTAGKRKNKYPLHRPESNPNPWREKLPTCECLGPARRYLSLSPYIYIYTHVYVCMCVCICMYVCMYVCMYIHIYIYVHMCVYIYIYICMYTYTYRFGSWFQ